MLHCLSCRQTKEGHPVLQSYMYEDRHSSSPHYSYAGEGFLAQAIKKYFMETQFMKQRRKQVNLQLG